MRQYSHDDLFIQQTLLSTYYMPVIILCLEGRVMDKIRSNLCLLNFMIWWLNVTNMYESEVAQLCPTLCDPMDCSWPGFSVHGIFQAGVLEWVAISFSKGSSQPRDRTQASCIVGRRFTVWAIREVVHVCMITIFITW